MRRPRLETPALGKCSWRGKGENLHGPSSPLPVHLITIYHRPPKGQEMDAKMGIYTRAKQWVRTLMRQAQGPI